MNSFKQLLANVIIFLLFTVTATAQYQIPTDEEIAAGTDEQKIEAGEALFDAHLYYHSLRCWKSLLKDYADNPKINYMAGYCQLKIGSEKAKSLEYLNRTLGHITTKTKLKQLKENECPLDAYFLLGQSCHLNGKFDDAVKYFYEYKEKGKGKLSEAELKEVERDLSWIENAKKYLANPDKNIIITNLGAEVNTADEEYAPVLSLDENILYFTSRRIRTDGTNKGVFMAETGSLYEDVYLSFRETDGKHWSKPRLMTFGNDVDDNEATVSVSADGTEVYIYVDKEGNGDLYSASFLEGGFDAELVHLTGDINSPAWETHCTLTPDGKTIFFTSNRPGGYGGLDIYRIRKLPNGDWSKAEILPPPINTPFDEDAPFIHPSGNLLYYSSNGVNSMGGCDVFFARITDPEKLTFDEPVNMGAPLNTVDDDVFFVMDAAGKNGYYSSAQNGGFGSHDIFMVEFVKPIEEPYAILKGKIIMSDGSQIPDNIVVNITNNTKDNEMLTFKPRSIDGGFVMSLIPCNEYSIDYYKGDELLKNDNFKVPCGGAYHEIYKELYIDTLVLAVNNSKNNNNTNSNSKNDNANNYTSQNIEILRPALFEKYFDYNVKDITANQTEFTNFVNEIKVRLKAGKSAEIYIESSASKVPTTTFKTNQNLANVRATALKEEIIAAVKNDGLDAAKISVKQKAVVQGPAYKGDYNQNKAEYGKYQFVKATMK